MNALDSDHIKHLRQSEAHTRETLELEGIRVALPDTNRMWQRRVFDDIVPDSAVADASEKILFRILSTMTAAQHTSRKIDEVLRGDFAVLEPLFYIRISQRTQIPAAFHVLPVKASRKSANNKGFTERTFKLLLRHQDGTFNHDLAERFLKHFRQPRAELDLAQQVILERLHPEWDPETEFTINLDAATPVKPFLPQATEHFQADLETLLALKLSNAEFFDTANRVLSLHLGLYLPRVATVLNPAMEAFMAAICDPQTVDYEAVAAIEAGIHPDHRFAGLLSVRAPSGSQRTVSKRAPALLSYQALNRSLIDLHFSLLMLQRLRELTHAYLHHIQPDTDDEAIEELSRLPSECIKRMSWDERYHRFLLRAFEGLAVKFIHDQITGGHDNKRAWQIIEASPTGAHALKRLYEMYNVQPPSSTKNNRADKQGGGVVRIMLGRGDFGLIQSRKGTGSYFELGVGLLPLLLTLTVGAHQEKLQLDVFWERLRGYGLHFASEDRELLLQRLKAMGLYERFSDAGEANYIRNPMVTSSRTR